MSAPTEYQTIFHDGKPAFVLVPAEDFERVRLLLARAAVRDAVPQAVVEANVLREVPMIRAWREHLSLTQDDVASRAGMKQSALARLERGDSAPRRATLAKLAAAMGLTVAQLEE